MIRGGGGISNSCFTSGQEGLVLAPPMMYGVAPEDVQLMVNSSSINNINEAAAATSSATTTTTEFMTHHDDIDDHDQSSSTSSFLYNLSVLKDKVHQVQSIASMFIISSSNNYNNNRPPPPPPSSSSSHDKSTAMAIGSLGTMIQEIIVTASSMMFTCQQLSLRLGSSTSGNVNEILHPSLPPPVINVAADQQNYFGVREERGQGFYSNHETIDQWYANDHSYNNNNNNTDDTVVLGNGTEELSVTTMMSYDIVELDAADLLAKYTHYCQVCGKGFKRDANLRMHMRAHGDEYKTSAALMSNYNPFNKNKNNNNNGKKEDEEGLVVAVGQKNNNSNKLPRKYSCPQEGCRWNRKHAKFTPLKSMICVKNHYKRSHCPKMYVCKRCNRKQFSVLSDLRTHEKHCGDLKWQCSCGTTFSRKDKLMGHVALFIGHSPAIASLEKMGKAAHHHQTAVQMQLEDK